MSLFNSKQIFGRDCDDILKDKKADPLEREICKAFESFGESFGNYDRRFGPSREGHRPSHRVEDENLDDLIVKDPDALERYFPSGSEDPEEGFDADFKPDKYTRSESVVVKTYPDGSMEETRTVERNDGSRETVVKRRTSEGETTTERTIERNKKAEEIFTDAVDSFKNWLWPKK